MISFSINKIKQIFLVKSPLNRKLDSIYKTFFPNENTFSSIKGSIGKMRAIEVKIESILLKDKEYKKERTNEYASIKKKKDLERFFLRLLNLGNHEDDIGVEKCRNSLWYRPQQILGWLFEPY